MAWGDAKVQDCICGSDFGWLDDGAAIIATSTDYNEWKIACHVGLDHKYRTYSEQVYSNEREPSKLRKVYPSGYSLGIRPEYARYLSYIRSKIIEER